MAINLSCSTICFRSMSIDTALEEIQNAGFENIDLAVIPGFCDHFNAVRQNGAEREDFVALIRNSGLRVPTVTAVPGNFNAPDADAQSIIYAGIANLKLTALLNAHSLNVNCGMPINDLKDRSRFKENAQMQAQGLKAIAKEAAKLNLNINVEAPHRNGLCRTLDEAAFLMDEIGESNVYYLIDVTHVQAGRVKPEDAVREFGNRIKHVHLRDGKGEDIFYCPGDGDIQFKPFFKELERLGYEGDCAFELEGCGETLFERRKSLYRAMQFISTQTDFVTGIRASAAVAM